MFLLIDNHIQIPMSDGLLDRVADLLENPRPEAAASGSRDTSTSSVTVNPATRTRTGGINGCG